MAIEVIGAGADGRIVARLQGHLPAGHLSLVARLLLAAAADPTANSPVPSPASRRGDSWSEQEIALLTHRRKDGAEPEAIAAELGRTASSIRYKLSSLGLGPYPGQPASPPRSARPQHTPAFTMEDLRQVNPNSHKRWEPEDDAQLARRHAEGATVEQLTAEFGRNENAITARLAKIAQRN
jgi:hypothetical protein